MTEDAIDPAVNIENDVGNPSSINNCPSFFEGNCGFSTSALDCRRANFDKWYFSFSDSDWDQQKLRFTKMNWVLNICQCENLANKENDTLLSLVYFSYPTNCKQQPCNVLQREMD